MSERIPPKKDGGFGTGAFKKAFEKPKRFSENQKEKGQGARKKESSRDEWLKAVIARISSKEKPVGADFLNALGDAAEQGASPGKAREIMRLASQRLDPEMFNRLKGLVSPKLWSQPTETPEKPPAPEQKPVVNEESGKTEDIKAPPTAGGISPEDSEKKSPEPAQQEPVVEPEPVPAVEAAPAVQTAEAAPAAPKEEMDTAQRVAMKLAEEIPESTPQELKKLLRSLVTKVEAASAKGSEQMKTLKEYLANRLNELNGEAREEGVVGRSFRFLGESYDKLDRKSKIAIGLSLGLGAGVLSAVSLPGALACMSGIALQRIAGLSSAFLKYEKNAQDEKWGKEKAMAKAIGQAAFMTSGALLLVGEVKEGVAYLKEQHVGDATLEWLKQYWPFGHAEEAPSPEEPLVTQEEAEAHTREVLAAEEKMAAEMASVEASARHGGETGQAGTEAAVTSEHPSVPDLYKETDEHIAKAEEHLANIQKLAAEASSVVEDTTPIHSQEEWDALAMDNKLRTLADTFARGEAGELSSAEKDILNDNLGKLTPEQLKIVDTYLSLLQQKISSAEHYMSEERTAEAPFGRDANDLPFVSEQEAKDFADLKHATHDPRTTGEWPGSPAKEQPGFFENLFGTESPEAVTPETFEIPATEAHVYATDSNELFVYGGSWDKQEPVIRSYLEAHPKEIVYSADAAGKHRIPWSLVDGRMTPGTPVRTGGFLGFGSSWAEAPDPKEFTRVIPLEHLQSAAPGHAPQAPAAPETSASPAPEASRIGPVDNSRVAEAATESGGGTGAAVHEFEHLKFGSAEGTFKYSPSGSVQSFNFEGTIPNPRAAESLLNENYRETLSSRPGGHFGLDQRAVSMNALRVSQYQQALDELTRRGADKSPEADFLRKGMRFIIDNVEKRYGDVFKN